jgi:hypothetical protein
VGWVVGFSVGFSLGTCCRIWSGPPIHFILIPNPLHTYRKCLTYFMCGGQLCDYVLTPLSSQYPWPSLEVRCRFLTCIIPYCYVMIGSSHPLNTYTRSTSYMKKVFGILYMWWAVVWLCPYSTITQQPWQALAKFGICIWLFVKMVKVMVCCEFGPQTTDTLLVNNKKIILSYCLLHLAPLNRFLGGFFLFPPATNTDRAKAWAITLEVSVFHLREQDH